MTFKNESTVELGPRPRRFGCGLDDPDFARRLARLLLRLYPHHCRTYEEALDAAWWRMRRGFHIWQHADKNEPDLVIEARRQRHG